LGVLFDYYATYTLQYQAKFIENNSRIISADTIIDDFLKNNINRKLPDELIIHDFEMTGGRYTDYDTELYKFESDSENILTNKTIVENQVNNIKNIKDIKNFETTYKEFLNLFHVYYKTQNTKLDEKYQGEFDNIKDDIKEYNQVDDKTRNELKNWCKNIYHTIINGKIIYDVFYPDNSN